jgi:hypothetical protein
VRYVNDVCRSGEDFFQLCGGNAPLTLDLESGQRLVLDRIGGVELRCLSLRSVGDRLVNAPLKVNLERLLHTHGDLDALLERQRHHLGLHHWGEVGDKRERWL